MKKVFLIISIIILSFFLTLFIILNISINVSKNKNEKVIDTFNNIFSSENLEIDNEYQNNLPKMQIDGNDYIGVINILKNNLSLPIRSECNNSFINIASACNYSNKSLVVFGTNLKNSFSSYKLYDVEDIITFTNTLGQTFQYKIKNIKRINKIRDLSQYNSDLIIVIRNYYNMEYMIYICDSY